MKEVAKVTVLLTLGELFLDYNERALGLRMLDRDLQLAGNCPLFKMSGKALWCYFVLVVTRPLCEVYVGGTKGVWGYRSLTSMLGREKVNWYHCTCDPGIS